MAEWKTRNERADQRESDEDAHPRWIGFGPLLLVTCMVRETRKTKTEDQTLLPLHRNFPSPTLIFFREPAVIFPRVFSPPTYRPFLRREERNKPTNKSDQECQMTPFLSSLPNGLLKLLSICPNSFLTIEIFQGFAEWRNGFYLSVQLLGD